MLRTAALAAVLTALAACPARAQWPTLHKDYQRSGYTEETVNGPYQRKWYVSLVEEMVGPRCEPIVAERLCFVGTCAGNVYALDIDTGKTVWKRHIGRAIGHSPCCDAGNLYVCSDDGYHSGSLVCLQARDGQQRWRYRAAAGVWNSPACDGRQVYVGDRAGAFHAVDAKTGQPAWTFQIGAMILKPASFSPDKQQIVFGSEDMHVYCLSPAGKLL
jgi:outer membrane protein assembly factor BamB